MPVSPFQVTFTVYDVDGTTLLAGAKCIIHNCTRGTKSDVEVTNSVGKAVIDLGNLPLGGGQTVEYALTDVLILDAYLGRTIGECSDAVRYVVSGTYKNQTLYLNPFPYIGKDDAMNNNMNPPPNIANMTFANTNASTAYYVKLWSLTTGTLIDHLKIAANTTYPVDYGHGGTGLRERFVVERENKDVVVTARFG